MIRSINSPLPARRAEIGIVEHLITQFARRDPAPPRGRRQARSRDRQTAITWSAIWSTISKRHALPRAIARNCWNNSAATGGRQGRATARRATEFRAEPRVRAPTARASAARRLTTGPAAVLQGADAIAEKRSSIASISLASKSPRRVAPSRMFLGHGQPRENTWRPSGTRISPAARDAMRGGAAPAPLPAKPDAAGDGTKQPAQGLHQGSILPAPLGAEHPRRSRRARHV